LVPSTVLSLSNWAVSTIAFKEEVSTGTGGVESFLLHAVKIIPKTKLPRSMFFINFDLRTDDFIMKNLDCLKYLKK
jgi:hypothetical protein